eukprot:Opistho-2@73723
MDKGAKILVTGSNGMVGRHLVKTLRADGYTNVVAHTRADCDLEDATAVDAYFAQLKPDYAFLIAALVGGISANIKDPVGFLSRNLRLEVNMFEACHKHNVRKVLYLGSSCIYPRECPQPMKEEYLMTGPVEPTNEGYALAKICGLKLAEYYHRQYGMSVVCPMPCNIYGEGDHFDLAKSHVLSALVKRFVDAKNTSAPSVTLWGTGSARREFVNVIDVTRGMLFMMDSILSPDIHNLGPGTDVSIKELAEIISGKVGYEGALEWDHTKPDGMMRKCLEVSKMKEKGFVTQVELSDGIDAVIAEYRALLASGEAH